MKGKLAKAVTWYMVLVMFLIGITPRVEAGFSPSEFLPVDRHADLQTIQKMLESKIVMERLKAFGFSPEEIQAKLNQLDDQQIHQIAKKIDELKVGGNAAELIIVALLTAILVVLIFYLAGLRVIVK